MKFIRDSLITLIARLLTLICGLAILAMTSRILGAEGRGIYAMVVLVVTILKMVSSLGVEIGNVFFLGRDRIAGEKLLSNSIVFSFILGFLAICLFFIFNRITNLSYLNDIPGGILATAVPALPFMLLWTTISYIYMGRKQIAMYNVLQVGHPVIFSIVLFIILIVFKGELRTVFIGWTLVHVLMGIGSIFIVDRQIPVRLAFYTPEAGQTIAFGIKAYLANAVQFLNYRFNYFLINYFLNIREVGYYSIAVAMAELLLHVPYAVGTVVLPNVSHSTEEEANQNSPHIFRHVFYILLVLALIFAVSANLLFPVLFSEKFNAALVPFYLLIPGVLALGSSKVIINDLAGRGRPGINMIVATITLVLNITLNVLLIGRFKLGLAGASAASSVSFFIGTLVLVVIFIKIARTNLSTLFVFKKEDVQFYRQMASQFFKRISRS